MDFLPFNPDEREAQRLAGGGAQFAAIRAAMPDQHRTFFAGLSCLIVATRDPAGWPTGTVLTGTPGFIHALDPVTLRIDAPPDAADPVASMLLEGHEIGLLGIDLSTRRRNRANGHIVSRDPAGFSVAVAESFGNCPQYIQRREVHAAAPAPQPIETLTQLDDRARTLIAAADTLFVASAARPHADSVAGSDISHRGGNPGFVRIDGDTLTIPDFRGNRYFNTLGNFLGEPRAALVFIDFDNGDLLQLQGETDIDWDPSSTPGPDGAERYWRFRLKHGWRRPAALPLRWSFVDYSPFTLRTGNWRDIPGIAAE